MFRASAEVHVRAKYARPAIGGQGTLRHPERRHNTGQGRTASLRSSTAGARREAAGLNTGHGLRGTTVGEAEWRMRLTRASALTAGADAGQVTLPLEADG